MISKARSTTSSGVVARLRLAFVATPFVLGACAGASVGDPSAGRQAAAKAVVDQQELLLEATPNTRCIVRLNDDPSTVIHADSDDWGLVHVFYGPTKNIQSAPDFYLYCGEAVNGKTPTDVLPMGKILAAQTRLRPIADQPPKGAVARPALRGDPASYSLSQLIEMGYPPRPDAVSAPRDYAEWLKIASVPAMTIPAHLVDHPDRFNATMSTGTTTVWSGPVLHQPGVVYVQTRGDWVVPAVEANSTGYSSFWVGIDGSPQGHSNDVVQGGTVTDGSSYSENGNVHYVSSYYAWVEWFPASESAISNYSVAAGDDVLVFSWIGDSAGNVTASGTLAWLYIFNHRTGVGTFATQGKPSSADFLGDSAEWIMERPEQTSCFLWWCSTSQGPLVNYGSAAIREASAMTSTSGFTHDWTTDDSTLFTLVNGKGQTLSDSFIFQQYIIYEWDQSE